MCCDRFVSGWEGPWGLTPSLLDKIIGKSKEQSTKLQGRTRHCRRGMVGKLDTCLQKGGEMHCPRCQSEIRLA